MKHPVKNQVNYNCHIFLGPCPDNSTHRKLILNDTDESSCTCDIKTSQRGQPKKSVVSIKFDYKHHHKFAVASFI